MQKLNLMALRLTDGCIDPIIGLLKNSALTELNIDHNWFTEKALRHFAEQIKDNDTIARFELRSNRFFGGKSIRIQSQQAKFPEQLHLLDSISEKLKNNAKK